MKTEAVIYVDNKRELKFDGDVYCTCPRCGSTKCRTGEHNYSGSINISCQCGEHFTSQWAVE